MNKRLLDINNVEAFFFDFDGVLTDNFVYTDETGRESVKCSRSDGLGFEVLKKINTNIFIVSTEKNKVVKYRAKKIDIPVLYNQKKKDESILKIAKKNNLSLKNSVYIGNDINDFNAMQLCGLKFCPFDSHKDIIKIADIVMKTKGGNGIVRELLEDIFKIEIKSVLYKK